MLTVKEVAKQLGVSQALVYKLLRQRRLTYTQVGRRKVVDAESVASYKRDNTVDASPARVRVSALVGDYTEYLERYERYKKRQID